MFARLKSSAHPPPQGLRSRYHHRCPPVPESRRSRHRHPNNTFMVGNNHSICKESNQPNVPLTKINRARDGNGFDLRDRFASVICPTRSKRWGYFEGAFTEIPL